jgi:hypothetical protein
MQQFLLDSGHELQSTAAGNFFCVLSPPLLEFFLLCGWVRAFYFSGGLARRLQRQPERDFGVRHCHEHGLRDG